jgi:hypothetical protein
MWWQLTQQKVKKSRRGRLPARSAMVTGWLTLYQDSGWKSGIASGYLASVDSRNLGGGRELKSVSAKNILT